MKVMRLLVLGGEFLFFALTVAGPSPAEICQFSTGNGAVNPYPTLARPPYLTAVSEPSYGGQVMRIANDYNASCGAGCAWQTDTRHHYSKDQPWSADGAVFALLNNNGTPPRMYLDGATFAVLGYTDHTNPSIEYKDWRWHPVFPYVQVVMDSAASTVYWVDVRYPGDLPIKAWYFGDVFHLGPGDAIGQYEGNLTADGNLLAITKRSTRSAFILNMSSGARGTPVELPTPNLRLHGGGIGWTSISPDGHYLIVKYAAALDSSYNDEQIRVFDVDPTTLTIANSDGVAVPHQYPEGAGASVPCGQDGDGAPLAPSAGWVHPLKHADMMIDGGVPVLVGVNGCAGAAIAGYPDRVGRVLRVDLSSGKVTTLSSRKSPACNPAITPNCYDNEAPASHVSARNLARPGWVYVTYDYATSQPNTKRFSGEIVAIPTDSSRVVERFALTHTDTADSANIKCGRGSDCQAQAVPDLYGARIVWASNWRRDCGADCGVWSQPKAYLLDARCASGGCPTLQTRTCTGWKPENSILSRSLTNTLSLDAYRLKNLPQVVDGSYKLALLETEREITTIDQVRLAYVDHPADTRAYALGDRILLGSRTAANRVTTSGGSDVTALVSGHGDAFFVGEPGETLTVELVKPDFVPPPASSGAGGADLDPFEIDPGDKDGSGGGGNIAQFAVSAPESRSDAVILNTTGILVQGRDAGGTWTTVRRIYPRKEFDPVLVDTLDQGPIRLVFVGRHKLRYIGRVVPEAGAITPQALELRAAIHTRYGDVRGALADRDNRTTSLAPGDTIKLDFAPAPVAEGLVRDFFLLSRGAYQSVPLWAKQVATTPRPQHFALLQNRPNPFPARTTIRFELPTGGMVRIDILDAQGRRVQTAANHYFPSGQHTVEWNPREAPGTVGPGVYFYRIQSGPFQDRKQMVLVP